MKVNKLCIITSIYVEPNFAEDADHANQVIQDDMKAAQDAAKAAGEAAKNLLGGFGSLLGKAAPKILPPTATVTKVY